MIIGGHASGRADTEVWMFKDQSGKIIDPSLPSNQYYNGLGIYPVPYNFCQ